MNSFFEVPAGFHFFLKTERLTQTDSMEIKRRLWPLRRYHTCDTRVRIFIGGISSVPENTTKNFTGKAVSEDSRLLHSTMHIEYFPIV